MGTFVGRSLFLRDELDDPIIKALLSLRVLYQTIVSELKTHLFFWCCVGRDSRHEEGEEIGSLCPLPVDSFLTVPPPRRPFTLPLATGRVSCSFWHPTPAAGFSSREVRFSAHRASPLGSLVLVAWTLPFGPPVYKRSSCSHSSYPCSIFLPLQFSNSIRTNFSC